MIWQEMIHRSFSFKISALVVTILSFISQSQGQGNDHRSNALDAVHTMQGQWYNTTTGLWDTAGWWNSANCLTMLADFAAFDSDAAEIAGAVAPVTFEQAQKHKMRMVKRMVNGLVETRYADPWTRRSSGGIVMPRAESTAGFLNGFYDDEGWWALAWTRVYDVFGGDRYLQAAVTIFEDMTGGWDDDRCNGGIWWDKKHTSEAAIANELFISVAAHLATRVPGNRDYYRDWALRGWRWFEQSGLINENGNVNDGLDLETCRNNRATVWSYNQGVILGALVELNKVAPNATLISEAQAIASAAIAKLGDANGVLHDTCEPDCGGDGAQFKGIFMRNLQVLQEAAPLPEYEDFIRTNADAIWAHDRNEKNELSVVWSGPFQDPANASTQCSALDALVAAASL